jgi:hypothetical protein
MNARLPDQRPVLPDAWINSLFDRLEAAYGSRWQNMWGNSSLQNVKTLWAEKLAGFADNPKAMAYALNALDEHPFPPTLPEFLALCRKAPRPELQALPAPAANPEKAAEFAIKAKTATSGIYDFTAWARKPKSSLAFAAVVEMAQRGERDFQQILKSLQDAGHAVGDKLLERWDGVAWVKA